MMWDNDSPLGLAAIVIAYEMAKAWFGSWKAGATAAAQGRIIILHYTTFPYKNRRDRQIYLPM
jgi:hypothetical protein